MNEMMIAEPVAVGLATLPWLLLPLIATIRLARSRSLRDESAVAPPDAPIVSVIVPARNEGRNIEGCVRSILATTYPNIEVIVANDHSTDNTATIARALAQSDPRVHVIDNPDLPPGWFGKQWACQNGAEAASGDVFLFVDADTKVLPEAITRSVNGMQRKRADLYTAMTGQEMHTFWERLLQPQIFFILGLRYGGTEIINASNNVADKIANGQFIMIPRVTYESMHGHALVRAYVAEDLKLAQLYFEAGKKTVVVNGMQDITTRMYASLEEVINGWRKNVYAGGKDAVPFGKFGQLLFPLALPSTPLFQLAPVIALLFGIAGLLTPPAFLWSILATSIMVIFWIVTYLTSRHSPLYALLFPVGATVVAYILISAVIRGDSVSWKGRQYISKATSQQTNG